MKDILDSVKFTRRGVVIGDKFILSDLHLGYSDKIDAMTREQEADEIASRLKPVIESEEIKEIVINGDVFHEFNAPSDGALDTFRNMDARVSVDGVNLRTTQGNHDDAAASEHPNLTDFSDVYCVEHKGQRFVVSHGHEEVDKEGDFYIVGHLHPMVKINGVKWPVYLFGESVYKDSNVLVKPAFNSYQDGVIVSNRMKLNINFPMIGKSQFKDLVPFVYNESEDNVRRFPRLEESSEFFGI